MSIDVTIKSIHIENCDVIIVLNVKISRIVVQTSIYTRKITFVLSYIEIALSIHFNDVVSNNRNFLFEFDNLNLSLYVHLINANLKNIFVKNDNDKMIQISRNNRVNRIIKLNFSNVFQIHVDENNDVVELIMRKLFSKHKSN